MFTPVSVVFSFLQSSEPCSPPRTQTAQGLLSFAAFLISAVAKQITLLSIEPKGSNVIQQSDYLIMLRFLTITCGYNIS